MAPAGIESIGALVTQSNWDLANRETPEFTPIGVDEIAYKRAHKSLTVVYQIDSGMRRLLWVGQNREAKTDGYEPILKHSRWCLLKRPANRTSKQTRKLRELLMYNLQTMRAYLRMEDFQQFWSYRSPTWAGKFLDAWCTRAMRSQLKPMKEMAGTLRRHREQLLNWFPAKGEISSGAVEGMNTKAKVALRKSYGLKTFEAYETVLYHDLAKLPEHDLAHQFC